MILLVAPATLLIAIVLWDVFEVIVLPRRVQRTVRPARYFYRATWRAWTSVAGLAHRESLRENLLGVFGPMSVLALFMVWTGALVGAYAVLYLAVGPVGAAPGHHPGFGTDLYFSGETFFTLGLGDISPQTSAAHVVAVLEAANGFAFLALVIGYLPVFYQSFSRRETSISLLDARAGSPPTAGELLRRSAGADTGSLQRILGEWERWAADLLESHLSYPVLMFFRSQHERQSWVAALTAILDVSALLIVYGRPEEARAARLTFAMARHAAVDLSAVFERAPTAPDTDRLSAGQSVRLLAIIVASERFATAPTSTAGVEAVRMTYEPYVSALSRYLLMPLPPWVRAPEAVDDWQTSRVEPAAVGLADPIDDQAPRAQ